jgi:hypothetical protein
MEAKKSKSLNYYMRIFKAISSFWMFKAGTKTFKRGMILIGAGIVFTVILLLF